MFTKLLEQLEEKEQKRKVMRVDFGQFFTTDFNVVGFDTPNQHIQLGNGYKLTKNAFAQVWKKIAYDVSGRRNAFAYHWQMPSVVAAEMPFHVSEQIDGRERSTKRSNNDVVLNVHDDVIVTAVHSTNYTDYGNYALVKEIQNVYDGNQLGIIDYTYDTDEFMDTLELKILTERYPHDFSVYGVGVLLINSQDGNTALHMMPFVKSTACDNSLVSMFGYHSRHVPNIIHKATEGILKMPEMINHSKIVYQNYHTLTNIEVYDMSELINMVIDKFRLPKKYKKVFAKGLNSERDDINDTLFNFVSGMTYTAQFLPEKHMEISMLRSAGKIVDSIASQDIEYMVDSEIITHIM